MSEEVTKEPNESSGNIEINITLPQVEENEAIGAEIQLQENVAEDQNDIQTEKQEAIAEVVNVASVTDENLEDTAEKCREDPTIENVRDRTEVSIKELETEKKSDGEIDITETTAAESNQEQEVTKQEGQNAIENIQHTEKTDEEEIEEPVEKQDAGMDITETSTAESNQEQEVIEREAHEDEIKNIQPSKKGEDKEEEQNEEPVEKGDEQEEISSNIPTPQDSRQEEKDDAKQEKHQDIPTSSNIHVIKAALDKSTEPGSGFMLSSQQTEQDESKEEDVRMKEEQKPQDMLKTTTVKFQAEKRKKPTYMTEGPEIMQSQDQSKVQTTSSDQEKYKPAYLDTTTTMTATQKRETKKKKDKKEIERAKKLAKLGLSKLPEKYVLRLRPLKKDPDPSNPAPLNPNIYITEVPKEGGMVKTPFYMQLDIPNGALDSNVRLRFEKQEMESMKLELTDDDKLCSYVIDFNMEPTSLCLRKKAKVKMRILDKCVNKFEELVIITSLHFSWNRSPTKIESKTVNGETHYYAVTELQHIEKIAVINTNKMDRFIITSAGGKFSSTILPDISLNVEEGQIENHKSHIIEFHTKHIRNETVTTVHKEVDAIEDVQGRLVSTSPLLEISKYIMGQSGKLRDGIQFPEKIVIQLPVPKPITSYTDKIPRNKSVRIMQKMVGLQSKTYNGQRYKRRAYEGNIIEMWKDVTQENRLSADGVSFDEDGEMISIKVTVPGKYMVLVFEEDDMKAKKDMQPDLSDLTETILETNREFAANIMVHQRVSQPTIFMIHMVTSDAIEPISTTMKSTKEWTQIYVSRQLVMHECQRIKMEFKGEIQLTVNQMSPTMRFYSRRWQGHQIQLAATDPAFSRKADVFMGWISFVEDSHERIRSADSGIDEGNQEICFIEVALPQQHAKPFKPTKIEKPVPKVSIFREYQMKWMKNMSSEDIQRLKAINGV